MGRWPKLFLFVAPIWGTPDLFERYIGILLPKKVPKQKTCQILRKRVICDYLLLKCITAKKFEILNSTITKTTCIKTTYNTFKQFFHSSNSFRVIFVLNVKIEPKSCNTSLLGTSLKMGV